MTIKPEVGEVWLVRGLWKHEENQFVRIEQITPTGFLDVNYELDESKPKDLRILPPQCAIEKRTTT